MDEKTNETSEKTTGDNDSGDFNQEPKVITEARKTAERMEAANARTEELIKRQENLVANRALGGVSEGPSGTAPKKTLTPKEYKDSILRGEVPKLPIDKPKPAPWEINFD